MRTDDELCKIFFYSCVYVGAVFHAARIREALRRRIDDNFRIGELHRPLRIVCNGDTDAFGGKSFIPFSRRHIDDKAEGFFGVLRIFIDAETLCSEIVRFRTVARRRNCRPCKFSPVHIGRIPFDFIRKPCTVEIHRSLSRRNIFNLSRRKNIRCGFRNDIALFRHVFPNLSELKHLRSGKIVVFYHRKRGVFTDKPVHAVAEQSRHICVVDGDTVYADRFQLCARVEHFIPCCRRRSDAGFCKEVFVVQSDECRRLVRNVFYRTVAQIANDGKQHRIDDILIRFAARRRIAFIDKRIQR